MGYDFPASPTTGQVYQGWTYDGEKWLSIIASPNAVRYDLPQGLTANQMAQARANINVTKRNYIINGAMMVSQEWGTTLITLNNIYVVDQFRTNIATTGAISFQQVASPTPAGSPNRIRAIVTTVDTSLTATEVVTLIHKIEGIRVAELRSGSAAAKTVTIQWGMRAPAGIYSLTVSNAVFTRSLVSEVTVTAGEANTDVIKSVTIPLDTAGTWVSDASDAGLVLSWGLMVNPGYAKAPGSWGTDGSIIYGSTNQFNFMGTVNNTFELFDVSLTEGSVAPPFQVPDYASELALCERYWQKIGGTVSADIVMSGYTLAGYGVGTTISYSVEMRTSPTTNVVGSWSYTSTPGLTFSGVGTRSMGLQALATATGPVAIYNTGGHITLNARL